ncbi:MAG: hypothetical protein HKN58_06170 [Xanthomonadales bacterium]|nr:hypothetical protein [Xanthomonadales bacterium]
MSSKAAIAPLDLDHVAAEVSSRLHRQLGHGVLRRIEAGRGDELLLEWVDGHDSRWYQWQDAELTELKARDDRKLPLAKLLRDDARLRHLRILSWRPGKRLTLLDNRGRKPHVLKGFRPKRFAATLARYEAAEEALQGSGMSTPDIIDLDDEMATLEMVYHEGHRLSLSLESTGLFRTVGQALASFQDSAPPDALGCFTTHDELAVIDKRHARLKRFSAAPGERCDELRARLARLQPQLPEPEYGLAHRDLHDKQIILHGRELVLLDFDLASRADRALDPANFLAHLVLRKLQGVLGATQRSIDACGERFIEGLASDPDAGFWPRLRFYQATSFCRLALVYRSRPAWRHLEGELVTMGHRCLEDLRPIEGRTRLRSWLPGAWRRPSPACLGRHWRRMSHRYQASAKVTGWQCVGTSNLASACTRPALISSSPHATTS